MTALVLKLTTEESRFMISQTRKPGAVHLSRFHCCLPMLATALLTCSSCTTAPPAIPQAATTPPTSGRVLVTDLRCEYRVDPVGIDVLKPRLSWAIDSTRRGQKQTAYQIQAAGSREKLIAGDEDYWDTGKVPSNQSIQVVYNGRPLTSRMSVFWRVRIWDMDGRESPWSEPASWSMGLLSPGDWKGKWIGLDTPADQEANAAAGVLQEAKWIWYPEGDPARSAPVAMRFFRFTFDLPAEKTIREGRCQAAADNGCTLFLNGERIGTANSFSQASELDMTRRLKAGRNVLAAAVSNVGKDPNPAGLLAGVQVAFAQGDAFVAATNRHWRVSDKEAAGWEKADFDDSSWPAAAELGPAGIAPWGKVSSPAAEHRTLPARMLRREFRLDGQIKRATVSVCGLGYCQLHLNGAKVGDHVLDPGLTDPTKRVLYATYDVTDRLAVGRNAIGVMLGNGRYFAPRVKYPFPTEDYGYPKMLLQMDVDYADGRSMRLASDETWRLTTNGPIRANNDYDGEEYDARMEQAEWDRPGFGDGSWQQAKVVQPPGGLLAAQMAEPIRITETIKPVAMTNPKPGAYIYDLGQNIVGWVLLNVQGPRGTRVQMRFAETLTPEGQLFTDNLRSARATDVYILKGRGVEKYEPRFTYHGFRYVELTGYPGVPSAQSIAGRVMHSDVTRVGSFNCSSPVISRVYQNMLWGIRGNLRSIPTDCPQRDERHGWLGDIANEAKAESFDFNMAAFFTKWLKDIQDAQDEKGNIPDVAPPYWRMYNADVTWPATYLIIPGLMYEQYGDLRLIETHYPSMKKWIDFMNGFLKDGIMPNDTYGDWCVPPEKPQLIHSEDPSRKTAGPLLATAYYAKLLRLMARYATLLGKADEAGRFAQQADAVAKAFNAKFFNPQINQYDNGTQTSSVLPLAFDLIPRDRRAAVFERLVENITRKTKNHIGTGLVGGQWLMRTLSDNGRADLACMLATNTTYPSWGYMAEKGATTIWELWNGDTADPAMNSHNHLMLTGDLGIWLFEYLAGIKADPAKPGFRHIIMRPYPVGGLSYVLGAHKSQLGAIISGWQLDNAKFEWWITVPPNTTATVLVPATKAEDVLEGDKKAVDAECVKFLRMEDGRAVFEVDSGEYHFIAPKASPTSRPTS